MTLYRFQTTYEELKLGVRQTRQFKKLRLPDYLWGIETLFRGIACTPSSCFQTTYEELKLRIPDLRVHENEASRLPMRNWNCCRKESRTLSPASRFQTTYEELKLRNGTSGNPVALASRLPMRNWNWLTGEPWFEPLAASRLPMRNWNSI